MTGGVSVKSEMARLRESMVGVKTGRPPISDEPRQLYRLTRSDDGRWTDVTRQKNPEGRVYDVHATDLGTAKVYAYQLRKRTEGKLFEHGARRCKDDLGTPGLKTFRVARLESGKWIDASVDNPHGAKVYEVETTSFYLAKHKAKGLRNHERNCAEIGERSL